MDIIDKINALLAANGKTGADMSRDLGFSNSIYSQWNTKKTKPSNKTLTKIAGYFDISVDDLLRPGLITCPVCGLYYDSSYLPDVKEHDEFHKTFCKAVEYFGDYCRPKDKWAKMKSSAYDILDSEGCSQQEKTDALLELIAAYFSRSLSAWGYSLNHPKFDEYAAMLLNQEHFKKYSTDAYNVLLKKYGKKPGIPEGETTYKIREIRDFHKKEKAPSRSGEGQIPHEKRREVLAEGGIRLLLDADAKVTEEQLEDIVDFIKFQQRKNGR